MNPWIVTLTPEMARARVADGAALLDEKRPGWTASIDLAALKIASCTRCVLAQSLDGFESGLAALGLGGNGADWGFALHLSDWTDRPYGIATDEERRAQKAAWALLQDAWLDAIADRTVPQVPIRKALPQVQEASCPTAHCS